MQIGELNTKIDICTMVKNEGPIEDLEPMYEPIINNIWAKKTRLLGQESIKLGLEHNTVQVNFIIRTRRDITENMYIKHDNVIHNVIGFENLQDDKNYMLIATVRKQTIA